MIMIIYILDLSYNTDVIAEISWYAHVKIINLI